MNRIGLDIGGSKIAGLVLSAEGQILAENRLATPLDYDELIGTITMMVQDFGPGLVGIGAPGSASPDTGLWRNANILFCNGKAFQRDLAAALQQEVRLENDANCFALSEACDGAAAGQAIVAFFTIGTALGGGLVIDGRIVRGAHHEAGEFGHMALPWLKDEDWPPLPCFCGKAGCAEQYVSGTGLQLDYARRSGQSLKGPEIIALARAGDGLATACLGRLQDRLARVAAAITAVVDPHIFVIGGGLSSLPELVEELEPMIRHYSFSGTARPRVVRAQHGEKSGALGAARLWDQALT